MLNKQKIYKFLVEGYAQVQVAKMLNTSRAYICRITGELEANGLIKCISKNSTPKQYKKTKKQYNPLSNIKLKNDVLTRQRLGLSVSQVQGGCLKANIISRERPDFKWDKIYETKTKLFCRQKHYILDPIGKFMVRCVNNTLCIYTPRFLVDKKDLCDAEEILYGYSEDVRKQLCNESGIRTDKLVFCQIPDKASRMRIGLLEKAVRKYGVIKGGDIHLDISKPDRIPEVESKDYRDIVNYDDYIDSKYLLQGISKIKNMGDDIDFLKKAQSKIYGICVQNQQFIKNNIELIKNNSLCINEIQKALAPSLEENKTCNNSVNYFKEDSHMDVA